MINPATVLLISSIDFNGPTIAPTAVMGVLRISPKKTTPNKINMLLFFFVIVPPNLTLKREQLKNTDFI